MKSLALLFGLLAINLATAQSTVNFSGQLQNGPGTPETIQIHVLVDSDFEWLTDLTVDASGNISAQTVSVDTPWAIMIAQHSNCNGPDSQTTAYIYEDQYEGPNYNIELDLDYCNEIFGCDDPEAYNYNPEATQNDGSCIYDCPYNSMTLSLTGEATTTDTAYVIWSVSDANGETLEYDVYPQGGDSFELCLEDGCYVLSLGWIHPDFEGTYTLSMSGSELFTGDIDGSSSNITIPLASPALGCSEIVFGCTDPDATNYNPMANMDDGSCEYEEVIYGCTDPLAINYNPNATEDDGSCEYDDPVFGCTDPAAFNYNPDATEDDGSCIYDIPCEISYTATADSSGNLIMYITPSDNIYNATDVLWDFGDGTTSSSLFPIHNYPTDGPYTLCLTAWFPDNMGGTCETTYCTELTSDMIDPPGMGGSSGFTINIVPPVGTSVGDLHPFSQVQIGPNPATEIIGIQFGDQPFEDLSLKLIDLTGKVMLERSGIVANSNHTIQIPVGDISSGLYILHLSDGHFSESHRVVIR